MARGGVLEAWLCEADRLHTSQTLVGRLCGLRKLDDAIRTKAGALLLLRVGSECRSGALKEATAATRASKAKRTKRMRGYLVFPWKGCMQLADHAQISLNVVAVNY